MAISPKDPTVEVEHEDNKMEDNKMQDTGQDSNVDPVTQKSLLRKLDYRMMPVFFVLYFLNHCKRHCLSSHLVNTDIFLKGIGMDCLKPKSTESRNTSASKVLSTTPAYPSSTLDTLLLASLRT